ncbi:MAG: gliding motility-associated C-terminal domain-containing protein [Saprospiraceae bacterium]|nr:gliding motility-associated C-terminal domain-containing protein [Saprospiraceae bacterium]
MKSRLLSASLLFVALFFAPSVYGQNTFTVNIVGPTFLCAGQCDTFYAQVLNIPTPASDSFKWAIMGPNGYTAFGVGERFFFCPTSTQFATGTYTLLVQVISANGAVMASDTHIVTVLNFLPLDIVSNNFAPCNFDSTNINPDFQPCEKVCPNTTVTYSVQASNPGGSQSTLTWQVSGALAYTVNPPLNNSVTVTWGGPGVGSVVVVADGGISGACAGENARCVTIIAEPEAKFTSDPAPTGNTLQVCKGQTVYFQNQSIGADGYEWFFSDDLSTSLEVNPQHVFPTPGNYTVRLIARSDCLCSDTTTLNMEVLDAEAPTLDCVGTLCPGAVVTYTASNACPPYAWAVTPNGTVLSGGSAGTDSITVQWDGGPFGTITLGAQPCSGAACPNPANIRVPIISDDAVIQGVGNVCPAATEVYSIEAYGGTGFTWTLSGGGTITEGQGTNRITVKWLDSPNPSVTHWLTVEYDNCYLGCGGKDSLAIRIVSPFIINGPVELCEGETGNFASRLSVNFQNIACNWTLFAPNGSVAWTSAAPTASPAIPLSSGGGLYRVLALPNDPSLTCSAQATWVVNVTSRPAKPVILGDAGICPNTTYTYETSGTSSANRIRWTVQNGPGGTTEYLGNKINVTWGSVNPRWISVAQVSNNGLNCTSDTALLNIQNLGLVFISGQQVVCEDTKSTYTLPGIQNLNVNWSISPPSAGAVTAGQGLNVVEIFWTEAGGHVISLDVCGQISSLPVTVIALPDPAVQYAGSVCPGQTTPIQTATPYINYSWRDANGTELADTPTVDLGVGSYSVQVEDANGCVGSQPFTVNEGPAPNISITTADPTGFCNNSVFVTLTALANADGDLVYQWFQNGNPVGANTPTFATNQYGIYSVQVTNPDGCTAVAGSISLFNYCGGSGGGGSGFPGASEPFCPAGSANFSVNATAECNTFNFQVIPSPQYVPGSAFWTFGISGGSILGTATSENPSFTFLNAGKYIATLRVTLQNGDVCVVSDSVRVAAAAQFTVTADCAGAITSFQDASTFLPGNSIAQWNWDFDDPASGSSNFSTLRNPTHLYANVGSPIATLVITANNGCTSTASQTVFVPGGTPAPFMLPGAQCQGNALEFLATVPPEITQLNWNFGDLISGAANNATSNPAYHSYNATGNFAVALTTTNAYGCTATETQILTITPNTLAGSITPSNPAPICEGTSVTLTAPPGAVSYLWSDNATTTASFTATQEGVYTVTMTDANGCTFSPPVVNVKINPGPDALIKALLQNDLGQTIGTAYPTLASCEGEDVRLILQSSGNYTYVWSNGNGTEQQISFTDDRNNLLSIGTHVFTVTVTDIANGCTSVTDPFVVTVNPVPSAAPITASGVCAGDANVLTYTGAQNPGWELIWNNGSTGSSITTQNPGIYFVRVVNEFGCSAKSNVLNILPGPNVAAIPGGCHTRCRPDTLCLPTIPNIVSWQWYFNGNPVPGANSPNFVATENGAYYAELTDIFGCTNQSDPLQLNLLDGFGNINGQVWADVNNNGIIDAGDTLVSGILVNLLQNGNPVETGQSGANGAFSFVNVAASDYVVEIDAAQLPAGWSIIVGQNTLSLVGCNALGESALLLGTCTSTSSSLTAGVCPGAFYNFNGTLIAPGQTQTFTLTGSNGCDSIVTVTVLGLPLLTSTLNVSVCPGALYDYNGTLIAPGQSQAFNLSNAAGCDSIVTVVVSALPTSASALDFSTCTGTLYDYNGTLIAPGETRVFTLVNAAGCDSIVTVTVSESPSEYIVAQAFVCEGDSLLLDGVWIQANSSHIFAYQNTFGCDSIVEVAVGTFGPLETSSLDTVICPGQTFPYNGLQLAPGSITDVVLSNIWGCDSIVRVTVNAYTVAPQLLEVSVCPGEAYLFNGETMLAGETRDFVFQTPEGCDSLVRVSVTALPDATFDLLTQPSCATSPTGSLRVNNVAGGLPPYRYSLDGLVFQDEMVFDKQAAGNYTVFLEDSNGCFFEQQATVPTLPALEVALPDGILPCDAPFTRLEPLVGGNLTGLAFRWFNGDTTAFASVAEVGTVWVEVSNQCETVRREALVSWEGLAANSNYVYVPNVFKPASNDPDNSQFRPHFQPGLTLLEYRFEVFDRWGNRLFSAVQPDAGWRGIFRGDDMNPGVFVWYLKARFAFCGRERNLLLSGDVTVVR